MAVAFSTRETKKEMAEYLEVNAIRERKLQEEIRGYKEIVEGRVGVRELGEKVVLEVMGKGNPEVLQTTPEGACAKARLLQF